MNPTKDTPIYNLKAVVQETGLKPDTLRAWERRYGVPQPKRTDSGHRLYSQNDIEMLHWLLARQEEGLSISRAVEMWQQMHDATGDLPSVELLIDSTNNKLDRRSSRLVPRVSERAPTNDNTIDGLTEQWVTACLTFKQSEANQVLEQAFSLFSAEIVCTELIQKAMARIGEGWYQGLITVQQEHFASALAMRRLEAMLIATPPPTRSGRILMANPPDEEHTFVSLMLSLLLRRRGWDVVYLGANVPLTNLEATLTSVQPNLVILAAQQLHTAATLLEMGQVLQQQRIPLAFGGRIFNWVPNLRRVIPGYFLGEQITSSLMVVEQVMSSLRPKPAHLVVSAEYHEAAIHFRDRQAQIEATLWEQFPNLQMPQYQLAAANHSFARTITAALTLGDIHYMQSSLEWVQGMLVNHHGIMPDHLQRYLRGYLEAAHRHLDSRASMLLEWLANELDSKRPASLRS